MGKEIEIKNLLLGGWSLRKLRREGYNRSTIYKVNAILQGKPRKCSMKKWVPIEKTCPVCDAIFLQRRWRTIYCSYPCYQVVNNRRSKAADIRKHERYDKLWGNPGYQSENSPLVVASEIFVAQEVLPKLGFTDIKLMRGITRNFAWDIMAKKQRQIYCVEVSMQLVRRHKARKLIFAKYVGWRALVCQVKPDLAWYSLKEIDLDDPRATSCIGDFMKAFRQGEIHQSISMDA